MLQVTNGRITLKVTSGAFREVYSHLGFSLVGSVQSPLLPEEVTEQSTPEKLEEAILEQPLAEEDASDEEEDELDLSEIPLSEMSFDQLCEYADQLELDYEGIKSENGLRSLIKANL